MVDGTYYKGEFRESKFHGQGFIIETNGDKYDEVLKMATNMIKIWKFIITMEDFMNKSG